MRLIDAENLMTVTDIREDGTEITYVPYSEIESAPTAYDQDKVVEQLEENADKNRDFYKVNLNDNAQGQMIAYLHAIEIVKGVGVNDSFTSGNSDNITKAVGGLDTFTKNWCMNCEETDTRNEPMFRCEECNFKGELGVCKIKEFVIDKTGDMPVDFGSMGQY